MKMTNEEMAAALDALQGLSESGKLGYAIARNTRKLKEETQEYLQLRAGVFAKYGKKINDTQITVPIEDYQREIGDISKEEHEVSLTQVSEDVFTGGSLTSSQMESLLWMVKCD